MVLWVTVHFAVKTSSLSFPDICATGVDEQVPRNADGLGAEELAVKEAEDVAEEGAEELAVEIADEGAEELEVEVAEEVAGEVAAGKMALPGSNRSVQLS